MGSLPRETLDAGVGAVTEPDVAAKTYAQWRATTLGGMTERVEPSVIFELTGPLHGKRVLDVGTGGSTYAIEASVRGALVTAVDPDRRCSTLRASGAAFLALAADKTELPS